MLINAYERLDRFPNRLIAAVLLGTMIIYPGALGLFHWAAQVASSTSNLPSVSAWIVASIFLALVFSPSILGFVVALRYGHRTPLSVDDHHVRNLAHFAVAVPPLYTTTGVYLILFGLSGYDNYVWVSVWVLILIFTVMKAENSTHVNMRKRVPPSWLRISHGVIAAVAILTFIVLHLLHNLTGLLGADVYDRLQEILRLWYQASWVEPIIITAFLFLIGSGIALLSHRTASFRNSWGTVLTTTGAYLGPFILVHMTAALIIARWKYGIASGWEWAAGEPAGLLADPWSIRLIPYYTLAVFAVVAHAACGLRVVLAEQGVGIKAYEHKSRGLMLAGALLALLIIAALLGLRL